MNFEYKLKTIIHTTNTSMPITYICGIPDLIK